MEKPIYIRNKIVVDIEISYWIVIATEILMVINCLNTVEMIVKISKLYYLIKQHQHLLRLNDEVRREALE